MPYISGEAPILGDRVKDAKGQLATVVEVSRTDRVIVKWDQGVVGIEHPTREFALVSRVLKSGQT